MPRKSPGGSRNTPVYLARTERPTRRVTRAALGSLSLSLCFCLCSVLGDGASAGLYRGEQSNPQRNSEARSERQERILVEAPAEIARLVEDCHGEEASTGCGSRLAAAERERNVGAYVGRA